MQIIPPPVHLVAKRFIEAPDESSILQIDTYFQEDFSRVVTKEYERISKIVSCDMALNCPHDPYDCYDDMQRDVLQKRTLQVKHYDDLWVSGNDYSKMRAVHDLHHVLLSLPFTWEGEYIATYLMIEAVSKHKPSPLVNTFIRSEILYHVAANIEEGYEVGNKVVLRNLL